MATGRPPKVGKKADTRPQRALAIAPAPSPIPAMPPMPTTLPDEAAEAWEIVCSGLPGLALSDVGDIEICVSALHEYRAISELLKREGYTQTVVDPETGREASFVPDSVVRLHKIRATAANTYRYHADRLGLSRMARARLNLLDLAGKSELVGLAERVAALREASQ